MDESEKQKKKKKWLGTALFILLNLLVVGVTAYFDFGREKNIPQSGLQNADWRYLLAVLGCFIAALASETGKYGAMLRRTTGRPWLSRAFEVAALGKYYDNITPLGAGGQPFQMLYLLRSGVAEGPAGALPVAGFLSLQGAFILIAAAVLSFGGTIVDPALRIPAFIGLGFYLFVPLALVFFGVAPRFTEKALRFFIGLGARLKLVREPEEMKKSAIGSLRHMLESIAVIFRERFLFIKLCAYSLIYQAAVCSMPYFVLRAFGNTLPFWQVFCSCVYIYLCITFIPTPGNAGVAEGSFYALFSVLGQEHLFWAMLIWRFFCYYMFIITGFGVTLFGKRPKRGAKSEAEQESA